MQSRIRDGGLRRDVCLILLSSFSLAVISSIAFVRYFPWANSIVTSDLSVAGMRHLIGLFSPILVPFALIRNGKLQSTNCTTEYVFKTPPLTTPWADQVGTNPWSEYPRPQLQRSKWLNLNGIWTYQNASSLDAINAPPFGRTLPNEVLVPSCLESGLSGELIIPSCGLY